MPRLRDELLFAVTLHELNNASRAEFTSELGPLFEHSPWVAEETWAQRPFRDASHLHAALCGTMRAAPRARLLTLIRAHPDLAGRLTQQNQLTLDSMREQASAGLNRLSAEELATFQKLNDDYRTRFDFPFIICARLNAKDAILQAMQARIGNPPEKEFTTALGEIEKIAWLRLEDYLKRN